MTESFIKFIKVFRVKERLCNEHNIQKKILPLININCNIIFRGTLLFCFKEKRYKVFKLIQFFCALKYSLKFLEFFKNFNVIIPELVLFYLETYPIIIKTKDSILRLL